MKLLITGFDPFGEDLINPSFEAVKQLPDTIGKITLIKKQLPTKYLESIKVLDGYISDYRPDVIICVGQAAGRNKISLEKVAINLMEARIKDNDGYQPSDIPVHKDGDLAYFSNLPLKEMLKSLNDQHIACEISYSAGTFVCNSSLYHLLYLVNEKNYNFKAGFIHIPLIVEQLKDREEKVFAMSLEEIVEALKITVLGLSDYNDII